ncbi:hypothetical protein NTGHW29_590075 [Candidatus Nitrotoga sp. HW29]|nr:hypothetical protein NTGHW29_590075 [Candidatus Nitrotoga sp. HW29]
MQSNLFNLKNRYISLSKAGRKSLCRILMFKSYKVLIRNKTFGFECISAPKIATTA